MARLVFEIEAIRGECSDVARKILARNPIDDVALEESARMDDALAKAHGYLKSHLRDIMLGRIKRNTRARQR